MIPSGLMSVERTLLIKKIIINWKIWWNKPNSLAHACAHTNKSRLKILLLQWHTDIIPTGYKYNQVGDIISWRVLDTSRQEAVADSHRIMPRTGWDRKERLPWANNRMRPEVSNIFKLEGVLLHMFCCHKDWAEESYQRAFPEEPICKTAPVIRISGTCCHTVFQECSSSI